MRLRLGRDDIFYYDTAATNHKARSLSFERDFFYACIIQWVVNSIWKG